MIVRPMPALRTYMLSWRLLASTWLPRGSSLWEEDQATYALNTHACIHASPVSHTCTPPHTHTHTRTLPLPTYPSIYLPHLSIYIPHIHTHTHTHTHGSSGTAELRTNFVSDKPSSWYSELYKRDGLTGGHVIMLGADDASKSVGLGVEWV